MKTELSGTFRAQVFCASPEGLLNSCLQLGMEPRQISIKGPCCIELELLQRDMEEFERLCLKCGGEMKLLRLRGLRKNLFRLRRRLSLLIPALAVALGLFCSSFFIWDIDIVSDLPFDEVKIRAALSKAGLDIGSFYPGISADMLRDKLLLLCPECEYMSFNVSGSRARVNLKMQRPLPELFDKSETADIIAVRPGKVLKTEVFSGVPYVQPGAGVEKGQLLISGFAESISGEPRFLRARGKITAETEYNLSAAAPRRCLKKTNLGRRHCRWAVKIGKKRLNLYIYSGKCIDECVKIIKEYNLGIEGLFALPLGIVREELFCPEREEGECMSTEEMEQALLSLLPEGEESEILETEFSDESSDSLLRLSLRASCIEEIGEIQPRQDP